MKIATPVSKSLSSNLAASSAIQLVFIILGGLTMDGGRLGFCVMCGVFLYLPLVATIILQRRRSLTQQDLVVIRYGFLFLFYIVACSAFVKSLFE